MPGGRIPSRLRNPSSGHSPLSPEKASTAARSQDPRHSGAIRPLKKAISCVRLIVRHCGGPGVLPHSSRFALAYARTPHPWGGSHLSRALHPGLFERPAQRRSFNRLLCLRSHSIAALESSQAAIAASRRALPQKNGLPPVTGRGLRRGKEGVGLRVDRVPLPVISSFLSSSLPLPSLRAAAGREGLKTVRIFRNPAIRAPVCSRADTIRVPEAWRVGERVSNPLPMLRNFQVTATGSPAGTEYEWSEPRPRFSI